jgi:hypothetical protein
MPESWEGVLILLAVTGITLFADIARRWLGPPRDPANYVSPRYPDASDYVPQRTPVPEKKEPEVEEKGDDNYWGYDEGGEGGNGEVKDEERGA